MSYEADLKAHYTRVRNRILSVKPPTEPKKSLAQATGIKIPKPKLSKQSTEKPRYTGPSLHFIARYVASRFYIALEDIQSHQRDRRAVIPRQVFYYLAYKVSQGRFSTTQIGRLAHKDHTTVVFGIRAIEKRIADDPTLALKVQICAKELNLVDSRGKPCVENGGVKLCSQCPYAHKEPPAVEAGGGGRTEE